MCSKLNMLLRPEISLSLIALLGHVTADIDGSLLKSFSTACQVTISTQNINLTQCSTLTATNDVHQAFVRVGFCTHAEFNRLKAGVCTGNGGSGGADSSSQPKKMFYEALNDMSSPCLIKALWCILLSVVAIILKQQEQYCSMINVNLDNVAMESCLTTVSSGCTPGEFNRLKSAACDSGGKTGVAEHEFSDALLSTSGKCMSQLYSCTHVDGRVNYFTFNESAKAVRLVASEKYCQFINYQVEGKTMEACLKNNACTSTEFDLLKDAVCSAASLTHGAVVIVLVSLLSRINWG